MMKWKRDFLILGVVYFALAALALVALSVMASAQTCTPPIFQGWPSSCSVINLRWLNRDNSSLIDHYEIYIGSQLRGTSPGNALSFSDPVGCGFGANYIIKQVMKSGASCQTVTTGGPHTGPCSTCNGGGPGSGVSIVSSANFRGQVSRGSLASIFPDPGVTFTDRAEQASSFALPVSLAGVTVEINGSACELLAVAPGQINFLLPDWLPEGPTEVPLVVSSTRGSVARFTGRAQINPQAPGIFTASANGEGRAASLWLVIYPSGGFNYFNNLPALNGSEQVFFLLYGTGVKGTQAELRLGNGRIFPSVHVGSASFAGLEQLTFRIPTADLWRSEIGAVVRVFAPAGGYHESQGFTVR